MNKKKVIIGLSGGIDSAASAYLLKSEGYEVIGVTFNFFGSENTIEAAKMIAQGLGIEHHVIHAQEQFKEKVITPFVEGYKNGETPNPCLLCNREMKFNLLRQFANQEDNAYIATGHYAEIRKVGRGFQLLASQNEAKDQSYFLYHLDQQTLSRLLFPLNCFKSKEMVRKLLLNSFPDMSRGNESQGICFIPKKNHGLFLKEAVYGSRPTPTGNFVDSSGKILGTHRGIHSFTIGQTRGLGISQNKRLVVVDIIPEQNTVVLDEEAVLYQSKILIKDLHFQGNNDLPTPGLTFKTCRWGPLYSGRFERLANDHGIVYSDQPVRAPAPGQALVFYKGRQVLGGGIIKKI